jgi:hypothetical protein
MYSAMKARLTRLTEPRNRLTTTSVEKPRGTSGCKILPTICSTAAAAARTETPSAPSAMISRGTYENEKMPFFAHRRLASRLFVERPNMRSGRT